MTDVPDNDFEVLGDPEALTDEFFNSLAALLIGITEGKEADDHDTEPATLQVAANKSTSQHTSVGKAG